MFKSFNSWGTDSNILKIPHHSRRLLFVLHLLVNRVIANATEHTFILMKFSTWENKDNSSPVDDSSDKK